VAAGERGLAGAGWAWNSGEAEGAGEGDCGEIGKRVGFERRVEKRPCIVLKGNAGAGPMNGQNFHIVALSVKPLSAAELKNWIADNRPRSSTHRFDFQSTAEALDAPFFQEQIALAPNLFEGNTFHIGKDAMLNRTDADFKAKLGKVLENMKAQIGGDWSIEEREIEVWEAKVQ